MTTYREQLVLLKAAGADSSFRQLAYEIADRLQQLEEEQVIRTSLAEPGQKFVKDDYVYLIREEAAPVPAVVKDVQLHQTLRDGWVFGQYIYVVDVLDQGMTINNVREGALARIGTTERRINE